MMNNIRCGQYRRVLSMVLAIVILMSMLPLNTFASSTSSALSWDVSEKTFVVGVPTEFALDITANGDENTLVKGFFEISDPDAISKLEYKANQDEDWQVISGEFGEEPGFLLTDSIVEFRATFKKTGIFTAEISINAVEDNATLCSASGVVMVEGDCKMSSDIDDKTFVVNEPTEFSFSITPNGDAGKFAVGNFVFSDDEAVEEFKYQNPQDGMWYEFDEKFGTESGLLIEDTVINLRAVFNKAGTYTLTGYMNEVDSGDAICFAIESVTVKARSEIEFSVKNIEIKYGDANAINDTIIDDVVGAEYTYKSDDETVVKVDEQGILTPVGIGDAVITVTRKENTEFVAATASYTVKVVEGVQGDLVWDKTIPDSIKWNDSEGYSNTVSGGTGDGNVTYSSNNTEVAEVNASTGVLTLKKPGIVTITATKNGGEFFDDQTTSYTLEVVKAELDVFSFAESNPDAINFGQEFANKAFCGSAEVKVLYNSSDKAVATVDENGAVTALKAGTVVITATIAENDYYVPAQISYTLTINQASQNAPLVFEKGTEGQKIKYGVEYTNAVISNGHTTPITYKSSNTDIATVDKNGKVTALKAGVVTITATAPASEQYLELSASYDLVIELADQVVVFEKGNTDIPSITYNETYKNKASATTNNITYESSDTAVATVNGDGTLVIKKAGTVTITATARATEQYAEASESYTITINKAEQTIQFAKGESQVITYAPNLKFVNKATSNITSDANIATYDVKSGKELLENFNASTGEFEIVKAGTIIIEVSFSGDDCYAATPSEYVLTVEKADQEIVFGTVTMELEDSQGESYTVTITFENGAYTAEQGYLSFTPVILDSGKGTGEITYKLEEDISNVASEIDPQTGLVKFTWNTGEAKIKVSKKADDNYNAVETIYTLIIVPYKGGAEKHYKIVGDTVSNRGWFTGNTKIVADEGYLVSYEGLSYSEWTKELDFIAPDDGKYTAEFFVKKDVSGNQNAQVTEAAEQIKVDRQAPSVGVYRNEEALWDKFLTFVTFGLYGQKTVFEVEANDSTSGIYSREYYIAEDTTTVMSLEEIANITDWKECENETEIPLSSDGKYVVYTKVTDFAGYSSYASTNGIICDNQKSIVDIEPITEDKSGFYDGDVTVAVSVTDILPYSGIKSVKYEILNNDTTTQSGVLFEFDIDNPTESQLVSHWDSESNNAYIVVDSTKNNSDNVVVKVTAVDNAGNIAVAEKTLKICTSSIKIDVEYIGDDPINTYDGIAYYDSKRTAKVVITSRTSVFDASIAPNVVVTETMDDTTQGKTYEIVDWETKEGATSDEATHTCLIKFNGNAKYKFSVEYTDVLNRIVNYVSDEFAVDREKPTAYITIDENNTWDKLLNTLTFGLWKSGSVTVTATPVETTSPIKKFEMYRTDSTEILTSSQLDTLYAEGKFSEYEPFTVAEDAKFVVYIRIENYAGYYDYICSDGYVVDMTESDITLIPEDTEYTHNDVPLYNGDVDVRIDVAENKEESYSGIKEVKYWVTCDGITTQEEVLYTFAYNMEDYEAEGQDVPTYAELLHNFSKTVTIKAENNNSCDVILYVTVTDNAGNVKTESVKVDIDITAPIIKVEYDNNTPKNVSGNRGYYPNNRTATITIIEKAGHFEATKATSGIKVIAVDFEDVPIVVDGAQLEVDSENYLVDITKLFGAIEWITEEGVTPYEATHKAILPYNYDANYTFEISYADLANNTNEIVNVDGQKTPYEFTVDKTVPTATITAMDRTWDKLLEFLTFGLFSNTNVRFSVVGNDATSPIRTIESYRTDSATILSVDELKAITSWSNIIANSSFSASKEGRFVTYIRVTDYAGNYMYINSDGYVVDKTEASITITPEDTDLTHNNVPLYNGDVDVCIDVVENKEESYSGIKEVKYWVTCDGVTTQEEVLYTFAYNMADYVAESQDVPTYAELLHNFSQTVTIEAANNNSCDVVLYVTVTDNAGNVKTESVKVDIDITAPTIFVDFDNDLAKKVVDGKGYFPAGRTATVVITERTAHFDAAKASEKIKITAVDATGETVIDNCAALVSEWTTEGNGNDATHTATIDFDVEANYEFTISYEDLASNKCEYENVEFAQDTVAPRYFAVDKTAPDATISVESQTWNKLLEFLTFGLFSNEDVDVSVTRDDVTSPIESIEYYKTDKTTILSTNELEAVTPWIDITENPEFEISEEEKFVVYIKVTDYAGNYTYINSDGYVLDKTSASIILTPDETLLTHNNVPLYSGDVNVRIDVVENKEDSYSGIKEVKYWVTCDGRTTQEKVLYTFAYNMEDYGAESQDVPTYAELLHNFSETVKIKSSDNNSSGVVLYVTVTDNAGNVKIESVKVNIDITDPEIKIEYDNNNSKKVVGDRGYYSADRTATITIIERTSDFEPEKATAGIKVKALDFNNNPIVVDGAQLEVDSEGYLVDITKLFGAIEWITEEGATPDEATHKATLHYNHDANYTFEISYADLANNTNKVLDAIGQKTPYKFTVDKTVPNATITVESQTWNKLLEFLTFGLFSNEAVDVSVTREDATSPIESVEYYKTDKTTILSANELDAITSWTDITENSEFEISKEEKFVVYLRVTDYAGNYMYINSDGVVVDKTEATITLTPEDTQLNHNDIPLYNEDVDVRIDVVENKEESYSGIKEVKYWVTCDGVTTQEEVLYTFAYNMADYVSESQDVPTYAELLHNFSQTVTIEAANNNSCDVVFYVTVTDNAGNVKTESLKVDIDITSPTIFVDFDNDLARKVVDGKGYFPAGRTATVVITERTAHFDAAKASKKIKITAVDVNGETVIDDCAALISEWTTERKGNDATHTATIDFTAEANYEFTVSYEDLASNKCEYENVEFAQDTAAPRYFAVDKTVPTGTVKAGELGTWDKLVKILTFGLWTNETVDVTGTANDVTTPIESVSYYKTSDTVAKSKEELEAIASWMNFDGEIGIKVPADEKFVVYIRIVDYAGNITYISTNGIVVDDTPPSFETVKPEITITPEPTNGIYNSNVTIGVSVIDPKNGDTEAFAGLKEIKYEVYNLGRKTQEGTLYSFEFVEEDGVNVLRIYNKGDLVSERRDYTPVYEDLLPTWSDKAAIVVDKNLNNSNDVKIVVYAVDNADNANKAECEIKIDITPAEIEVTYDNNNGDTTFAGSTYFKANRTAKIVVTERNFNPDEFKYIVTNTDGYVPVISSWVTKAGTKANGDDTTHTATIVFDRDGDYKFTIESCVDEAMNKNNAPTVGNTLSPWAFTIDKTAPVVRIVYNNNDSLNGNYYKAQRIATITVTEHNFETVSDRLKIKLVATDNGVGTKLPIVSNWSSNGDVHTATISFVDDARYVFDFDYTDKAGNSTEDIAEHVFYVDKTNPVLKIENIVDESANNDEGDIGFVMTATDTNFDVFTPVLTAVVKNGDAFETKKLDIGEITNIKNGKVFTVTNIDADGIYRITCTVVDKAGNAYSEVMLKKADGTEYTEQRADKDTLVTFSVNRDGSSFEVDKSTVELVKQYYIQNVENDVVIVEINADPLKEYAVTLNDKTLEKGKDYSVTESGGNGAWMKYTYKVNKALFGDEGEYKLVVTSKDKTDNDAFSDVKEAAVKFVVDRTAPVVTVSGIANNGRYQTDKQIATLIPTDDGGALNTLVVNLVDEEGKVIKEVINLAGEALLTELENNGGKITFEIAEGLYQNVQIICTDCATGESETTNVYDSTIKNVSVSSSTFMIFWANKPLRWGTIGGVSAIIIAFVVFVILKKKKRKED